MVVQNKFLSSTASVHFCIFVHLFLAQNSVHKDPIEIAAIKLPTNAFNVRHLLLGFSHTHKVCYGLTSAQETNCLSSKYLQNVLVFHKFCTVCSFANTCSV